MRMSGESDKTGSYRCARLLLPTVYHGDGQQADPMSSANSLLGAVRRGEIRKQQK